MGYIDDEMNLLEKITIKRAVMTALWNERGYTDVEILESSIQLDYLLNQYQQLLMGKKEIQKQVNIA
ncbi:MAG TPA: hypothetical protein DDW50_15570 [Firmicutes bacterium]|jgi:hypothetical protein|nr:hypothetical protein [Bacillota bacterium]